MMERRRVRGGEGKKGNQGEGKKIQGDGKRGEEDEGNSLRGKEGRRRKQVDGKIVRRGEDGEE